MVRAFCFCVMILASASLATAGLVTIDAMVPGPFPTSPSFLNASGVGVNNVTRTLSSTGLGGFGFSANGQAIFGGGAGQAGTITYNFSTPLTLADFSTPENTNWLMELNVTSSNLSAFSVTGFVNGTSYGPLTGTGDIINAYFLGAVSGDINSLSFRFENTGPGGFFETIAVNSVRAVPEPASLLTAGAFSLIGGLMYRRRKAKKMDALTA